MTKQLQFHFRQHAYVFRFRIGFFLLCSFFTVLFCVLGVWQLHRYHFKKNLLQTYQERLTSAPQPFTQLANNIEQFPFQKVDVSGTYANQYTVLLQNQFYHDQLGFEVLTPLQIPGDKKLLLVDRGWVPATQNATAPTIDAVTQTQHIQGYIKLLNEYQFILGKNSLDTTKFPVIMQKVDIKEISHLMGKEFYPVILRLDAAQPNGFVRDWQMTSVIPARHMMYAVQWFAMAFVLIIAYLCFAVTDNEKQ